MSAYPSEYFAKRYLDVCRIAMKAAKIMAEHGAEAYRIEDTASRLLKTTGFTYTEAHSSVTGLMICLDDPSLDHEVTLVSRVENHSNDLSKISLTNDLSRRFVQGELSVEEAEKELDQITSQKGYPLSLVLPCYGIASAFFTFMFGGYFLDALCSFLIGTLVGLSQVLLKKIQVSEFVRLYLASSLLGIGFVLFFSFCHVGQHAGPILYGAIMPLVPGMLITVSIRDLLNGDYLSGIARIVESFLIAIAIAAGVSIIVHFIEGKIGTYDLSTPSSFITFGSTWFISPEMLFQTLCSFIASFSFIVLFHAEKRHLICCGLCGALTWFVYFFCQHHGVSVSSSNFLGALSASILSFYLARKLKSPVTVFFTGGILCLVPGAGMFRTMYYVLSRDIENGVFSLLSTLEVSGLIAASLIIHSAFILIMQHLWPRRKPKA